MEKPGLHCIDLSLINLANWQCTRFATAKRYSQKPLVKQNAALNGVAAQETQSTGKNIRKRMQLLLYPTF